MGIRKNGTTPHHKKCLLYVQVSAFSEVGLIMSGLPQTFIKSALVVIAVDDGEEDKTRSKGLSSRALVEGVSFLHSSGKYVTTPKQPESVIDIKDAQMIMSIGLHIFNIQ
jgi:hypothetical protein